MMQMFKIGDYVRCSSFSTETGTDEYFLITATKKETNFSEALDDLDSAYMAALEKTELSKDTLVFSRFYLSDITNQKDDLRGSRIYEHVRNGAVSMIEQCPLNEGPISLFTYHVKGGSTPYPKKVMSYDNEKWRNGAIIQGKSYDLVITANFTGNGVFESYKQADELLHSFVTSIGAFDMTLIGNTIRKWIYVRDIDNHYMGMVDARRKFFETQGLTVGTRFIASTGIEAKLKEPSSLVSLDALSVKNLKPEQIIRMEAPENLSPTIKYGVTFERGTRIRYGDRSHLYISGTASIDKNGEVLFPSDVQKQTVRTLDNIKALLAPHGAGLEHMAYYIVYLRNSKDKNKVMEMLEKIMPPKTPFLFVEGSVCRPTWLVEIEGMAIIPGKTDFPPFF